MNDQQLLRYSRQILLPALGIEGQERLLASKALVLGLGGLGSPVAMYLAAAGVGELLLADFDAVDLSNLQRQLLHNSTRIGQTKVDSAIATLSALNPETRLRPIKGSQNQPRLAALADEVDLILDCSDNFQTRFAANAACFATGTPLVSGAAIRAEGQVTAFSGRSGGPCYQCLFPRKGEIEERCSQNGVLAPLVGIIGSVQATEALKILAGFGEPLYGRLLLLDAMDMRWRELHLPPDPNCPICGNPSVPTTELPLP